VLRLRCLLSLRDCDGAHRWQHPALGIDQLGRGDFFQPERHRLKTWSSQLGVGQLHQRLVVLPCGEVAVDFSEKRATTTREQLRRVHGVFDRVTQHHDTGPTRQSREDAQHVLIGTRKYAAEVSTITMSTPKFARLGDTPVVHLPNVENAGNGLRNRPGAGRRS
jgi:hypothetical protein